MSNLFELSKQFNELLELSENTDNSEETLREAITSTLESVENNFNQKVIDCVKYIKNLEAQSNAIKEATEKMQARKAMMDKRIENIKTYVIAGLNRTQKTSVECEYFTVSTKRNPPSVEIINMELIPADFTRQKITFEVDKTAIKKAGGCKGAILIQKQSLVIR